MNPHCLEIAQGSKIAFSPLSIKPHLLQLQGKFPYFFYNVEGGKMNTKKSHKTPPWVLLLVTMFRECSVFSWSLNKTIRWLVTLSFPRAYNPPFPLSPSFAMPQWVADYRSCTFGLDDIIFFKKKIKSSYPSKEHHCFLKKMRFVTLFSSGLQKALASSH